LKLDSRKRQYDNGPGQANTFIPDPALPDDISARTRPDDI